MTTRRARAILACAALALLALPAAARADNLHADFRLQGSNGFEIDFDLGGGYSEVTVTKATRNLLEETEYTIFGGNVVGERLVANFGSLGRISVKFRPTSRAPRRSVGCASDLGIRERGVFVGSIRFRGENGLTRISRKRARGTLTRYPDPNRKCRGKGARTSTAADQDEPLVTSLAAASDAVSTSFEAIRTDEGGSAFDTKFVALSEESIDSIYIDRTVEVRGSPATFAFDPSLNSATVSPPAPFAGSATYQRLDDFASRWQGSLSVTPPGGPVVPLTGRDFAWSLRQASD